MDTPCTCIPCTDDPGAWHEPECPMYTPPPGTDERKRMVDRMQQYTRTHGVLTDEDREFFAKVVEALTTGEMDK